MSQPDQILTAVEQLRELWAEVLQQDPEDILEDDIFFELGGDSITALDLAAAAQKRGILLTVEKIFTYASLREMSQEAESVDVSDVSSASVSIGEATLEPFELLDPTIMSRTEQIEALAKACDVPCVNVENAYPCTPMQEALMTASEGDSNLYLRQLVYKISDDTPFDRLKEAWEATVLFNPLLRTRLFPLEQVGCLQAVVEDDGIIWSSGENLADYLEQDTAKPMRPGGHFFRYGIVSEGQSRYLVWSVHHALCDGACILEIQDEVSRRFKSETITQRLPFEHYVKHVMETDHREARSFWQRHLSGISPTPYPRRLVEFEQANSASTLKQLIHLGHGSPIGLPKALLLKAAWAILLSFQSANSNVVFGTIMSGRGSNAVAGISRIVGPTISLLPIAMRVNPEDSIASFLSELRREAGEMMNYEHTGMSKIRRYLAAAGALGSGAVCDFQNLFVVQPMEFGEASAPALDSLRMQYVTGLGKIEQHRFPLVVSASLPSSQAGGVEVLMQYDERFIPTKQAHNLMNQYQEVLTQLCYSAPEALVGSISPLSNHDLKQIRTWNRRMPAAQESCFQWIFQEQVHKRPHADAVASSESCLSYAEVENISSAIALQLIDLGVGPEVYVALCFEKSIWTVVAMLAIFKAGGAFVPIDPHHPRGRVMEVLSIAQITVAVVSSVTATVMNGLCENIVMVGEPPVRYIPPSCRQLFKRVLPSNTAYILFTSGSTGKPKGVVMTHVALCTSILDHGALLDAGPHWRTLQFSSHTFDASIAEFFTTLAFGGCICVPSDHDRMNDLPRAITQLRVNTALITPTVANLLSPNDVPTLKTIVLGGEPVTQEVLTRWAGHVQLVNGYGPTETCVYCSLNLNLTLKTNPSHIGQSVGGTMWIVETGNHHRLSPIGCVGEIVVSGATLARGYHGDKTSTDAAFIAAPAWLQESNPMSKLLYKTGDLARYTSEGIVQIIGRKDTQIKLRGLRIELGEIESRIMGQGQPTAAIAIVASEGPCARQIVAVINFNQARELTRQDMALEDMLEDAMQHTQMSATVDRVKSHLALGIPDYMTPTIWLVLNKLPLLVSGKIDRKSIKAWVQHMSQTVYEKLTQEDQGGLASHSEIAPGTPADVLRQIYSNVLNIPSTRIGLDTSFFSLGGDSISAIQIVFKAKELGLNLTTRNILDGKTLGNTLREMTNLCVPESTAPNLTDRLKIPYLSEDPFDLSPIQRLFLKANGDAASVARFNQGMMLQARKQVSVDTVRDAFSAVVARHSMLRTIFPEDRSWQKQQILNDVQQSYRFAQHDGKLQFDEIEELVGRAHDSLSIISGPVFSVDIFNNADGIPHLFVVAHHLVVDMVSWRIILQDVEEFMVNGSLPPLVSSSFYQWTRVLEAMLEPSHEDGWAAKSYDGSDDNSAFPGFLPAQNTHAQVEELHWTLDQKATRGLFEAAGVQAFAEPVELMIAAVANGFVQAFGEPCPTLFVEGHGREPLDTGTDLAHTVGWFTVLYPIMNFPTTAVGKLKEYVQHVKSSRKAYPDNGLNFFSRQVISDASGLMTKPIQFNYHGKMQQFENAVSMFSLVDHPGLKQTLIGAEIKRMSVFEFEVGVHHEQLEFSLTYPRQLECTHSILNWFRSIKQILMSLETTIAAENSMEDPELSLRSLGLPVEFANIGDSYDRLIQTRLVGVTGFMIEHAYLCTPMQREMLRQQLISPGVFLVSWDLKISCLNGQPPSLDKLTQAWQYVVRKHPILRTTFLVDPAGKLPPVQVVLGNVKPDIVLSSRPFVDAESSSIYESLLPHRAQFAIEENTIHGRIQMSHLLLDGWSLGLVKADILDAYEQELSVPQAVKAEYRHFVAAHKHELVEADAKYWRPILQNQIPTIIPLGPGMQSSPRNEVQTVKTVGRTITNLPVVDISSLSHLRNEFGLTSASIVDAAWAQALAATANSSNVCFAYIVSGRDIDIPGAFEIVGPLINMLLCHVGEDLFPQTGADERVGLAHLALRIQEQRFANGKHTLCGINELTENRQLANTAVNYQRRPTAMEKGNLRIQDLDTSTDPWPFDVLLRAIVDDNAIRLQIEANAFATDPDEVQNLADIFWSRLQIAFSAVHR